MLESEENVWKDKQHDLFTNNWKKSDPLCFFHKWDRCLSFINYLSLTLIFCLVDLGVVCIVMLGCEILTRQTHPA